MSVYFLSDLHIDGPEDSLYAALVAFLRDRPREGDTVLLAGDLFDLFVGGKRFFCERYNAFFDALRAAGERGARFHYIEGNHDFLLKPAFKRIPNLELHSDSVSLQVGGKRFFVAHGDLVDRKDIPYLALRAVFRSPLMKGLVRALPGQWVDRIGQASSQASRGSKPVLPVEQPLRPSRRGIAELRNIYRSFAAEKLATGYDFVVLGHCHDLDEMSFIVEGREGQYINVGYPRAHGSILAWEPGDAKIRRERFA